MSSQAVVIEYALSSLVRAVHLPFSVQHVLAPRHRWPAATGCQARTPLSMFLHTSACLRHLTNRHEGTCCRGICEVALAQRLVPSPFRIDVCVVLQLSLALVLV